MYTSYKKCTLRMCSIGAVMLLTAVNAARAQDPSQRRKLFDDALKQHRYEVASKLAVLYFQPVWHCEVLATQAREAMLQAQSMIENLESQEQRDDSTLEQIESKISKSRDLGAALMQRADQYVEAGWNPKLKEQARNLHERELTGLDDLDERFRVLRRRGKPFDVLISQQTITLEDIEPLDWDTKWIMGFYLVDRGAFEQAIAHCFEKLQMDDASPMPPAAKEVAGFVVDLLRKWHVEAPDSAKWNNLVHNGLEHFDSLREILPERGDLAGWFIALIAHLARDHYDVREDSIEDVLAELEKLNLEGSAEGIALLKAKFRHEKFLLKRRAEQWSTGFPPVEDLDLFVELGSYWYAAEAALIAAGSDDDGERADAYRVKCKEQIALLAGQDGQHPLATALNKRVQRYDATRADFDHWLEVARRDEFLDSNGMVLPEVLVETRPEFMARVRRGYEERIHKLISIQELEQAFILAQEAKALTVGRRLKGLCVDGLLSSRMMVMSVGDQEVPNKELFIEYFFGPSRAWAFYLFAPGDEFDPLQVVELHADQVHARCKDLISRLQAGQPVEDPGGWMLDGKPAISELWGRQEFKVRRMVIAPDGPLCYLPLAEPQFKTDSSVTFIPTAAVLGEPRAFNLVDLERMWKAQRGDLTTDEPKVFISGRKHVVELWPKMRMELQLRDSR